MKSRAWKYILVVLAIFLLATSLVACNKKEIDTTVRQLELNYDMAYCGISLKDLSPLFDEQDFDPLATGFDFPKSYLLPVDYNNDGDIDDEDYASKFEVTIDFQVKKHIDHIYLFYKEEGHPITIQTGTAFKYENTIEYVSQGAGWNRVDIGKDTQYINFIFSNSPADPPYEILAYGYDLGEEIPTLEKVNHNRTLGYLVGINGQSKVGGNSSSDLACAGYFRDYTGWRAGYHVDNYPAVGSDFSSTTYVSRMDVIYKILKDSNTESVPCFEFYHDRSPAQLEGSDKMDPASYVMYAEFLYQYTLRYGNNPNNTADLVKTVRGAKQINKNLIKWIELGNEPNGEDSKGYTPYQLAALTSASYDGHCGTMTSPTGSGVGIKNADPNIKVAISGLAGIQTRYIKTMCFWLKNNRPDGTIGMDAFNVHTYCRKIITYNGYSIEVGVSPEAADLAGQLSDLIEFRDTYYPEKEIWLTEFGWDTNQSYLTEGSAHAYGPYTGRQVQAMWLVRSYLILSSIGVDRAAMYMALDCGDEEKSVGKYGTSGVLTYNKEKKDSYFYIYTLKNTMNDMYFVERIDSGNEDVWIYKYENGNGKTCYALWCPTSDNVRVDGYQLNVGGASSVTLTEMAYGERSGISTSLTPNGGAVSVNVSECPILVFAE